MLEREDLSVLTAEYALGLLSGEEEREIARRLKDDRVMQDELMFWESRLIDLMPVLEVAPPPRVLAELKARLFDIKMKEQQAALDQIGGAKKEIAFGSQIRSYFMHPTQRVKDHRTGLEQGSIDPVLDGDLDVYIRAFLTQPTEGSVEP